MKIDTARIGDLVLGKLSAEESLRLLEEIERDPEASAELEARTRLLGHVKEGGESLFVPETLIGDRPVRSALRPRWGRPGFAGYAIGLAALLIVTILPLADSLTRGSLVDLAAVEYPRFEAVLRSAGDSDIDLAVRMLRSGHPEEALLLLERFCRAYPGSDLRDYAHYLAGAIYLFDARVSFLGMFASYETSRVQAGLAHLDEALRLSSNPGLAEESRWLRAKAFLMLERPTEALAELESVVQLAGQRRSEALELRGKVRSQGRNP